MSAIGKRAGGASSGTTKELPWQPAATLVARVDRYLGDAAVVGAQAVLQTVRKDLRHASAAEWQDVARQFLQRGQPLFAAALLDLARQQYPANSSLHYWSSQSWWQAGDVARAEAELHNLLARGTHLAASQLLAQLLRSQGRLAAAAACMAEVVRATSDDIEALLRGIQFVRECHQHALAAELCDEQLSRVENDSRLHAVAGQIRQELGQFVQARVHYTAALAAGIDLNAWFIPASLASLQRYRDRDHEDFSLLETCLGNDALSPRARASILFALGKACDDLGAYTEAANAWRQANSLLGATLSWSRAQWQNFVRERRSVTPMQAQSPHVDTVPIFVVGLPRTGTTLMAELLGRHPDVCNRGELPTLEFLAQGLAGLPMVQRTAHLDEAAKIYLTHLRRDDVPMSHYVDKNPLNFRYLDHAAAMLPQARVIHCRRQPRDTALSIWSQPFARDEYAFARDFGDIAAMMEGCDTLMAHWRQTLPLSIITVDYEQLVADPTGTVTALLPQLGLSAQDAAQSDAPTSASITSASLWQARQPVHTRSVSRWRHYAELLPELVELFAEH